MNFKFAGRTARGVPEEATSRMVTVVSGGGVDRLASKAAKATWAGGEVDGGAEGSLALALAFRNIGVKGEGAEDILHKART